MGSALFPFRRPVFLESPWLCCLFLGKWEKEYHVVYFCLYHLHIYIDRPEARPVSNRDPRCPLTQITFLMNQSAPMVNRYQRRNSRPYNTTTSMPTNYTPHHHPRGPYQPPLPHAPTYPPTHTLHHERHHLLLSLQREDARATALLTTITELSARLASGPLRGREAKFLKRELAKKRQEADGSARQERAILMRLGEVTLGIQMGVRWGRVQRGRGAGVGGLNGGGVGETWGWGERLVPMCESQPQGQGYYGGQGWEQQFPAPGYVIPTPPASTEGGIPTAPTDWQHSTPPPLSASSSWDTSRISGCDDAADQPSPQTARSEPMVELGAGRRGEKSRMMSLPSLGSGAWEGGGCPRYLGYYSPGGEMEMVDAGGGD